jgi:N-acetylglucosamine-6-phosphate deacetylase
MMNPNGKYFDLQVNGYGGVDFNQDDLSPQDLHRACEKLRADDVGGILATIITENLDLMCSRIKRILSLRSADPLAEELIAGIHVEGPFISPAKGFIGCHPPDAVKPATTDGAKRLLDACDGLLRLFTLAPECDADLATTKWLAKQDIVVSAGHTDASLDQLRAATDAGLSMVTHLGNGCPMSGMHRHDNIIQRALHLRDRLWLCFIADMTHVPLVALKNYLALAGDRAIVVTDAIAPAGLGPGRYRFGRWDLLIADDMVARAPDGSHLVGAAITMKQSHANLLDQLGLTESRCRQLLVENPRTAVGNALITSPG